MMPPNHSMQPTDALLRHTLLAASAADAYR